MLVEFWMIGKSSRGAVLWFSVLLRFLQGMLVRGMLGEEP